MNIKQIIIGALIVYAVIAVERFLSRPTIDNTIITQQAVDAIRTRQINDSLHRVINTLTIQHNEKINTILNYTNSQLDSVESMRDPRAHISRWMQGVH